MQTLEAIISFTVFMVFTSYVLLQLEDYNGIDDSLYRYQLANDVWRVLYLKGDFKDLSVSNANDKIVPDLDEIERLTGICTYFKGVFVTSCTRGVDCDNKLASISHAAIVDGVASKSTLSLCTSQDY